MGAYGSVSKARFHLTADDIISECGQRSDLAHKSILVTGATSGIGIETARSLACAGAKVYLMGRDQKKLQGVYQNIKNELERKQSTGSIQSVVCDLNSLVSIKQFAQKFTRENQSLNILILNAGLMNNDYAKTVDGLEQMIGVNHIAHAYLTKLLMPTLIANAPSRIVVLSSALHSGSPMDYEMLERWSSDAKNAQKCWSTTRGYQQSKLANVLFTRALANRYHDKQITAYSLHPGVIITNLATNIPLSNVGGVFFKKKTIAEGAATTVYCAIKPGLENENGRYFSDSTVTDLADKWTNEDIDQLWNWTEKIIRERTANL